MENKHCQDCYYFNRETNTCIFKNKKSSPNKNACEKYKPILELYREILEEAFDR